MATQQHISKLAKYFPILEVIALAGFAAGHLFKSKGGLEIIIISLSILSAVYFLTGYVPEQIQNNPESQEQPLGFSALLSRSILPKILWIGSSITVIGILFTIQHFNGSSKMLIIGTSTLTIVSILGLVSAMNDEQARKVIGKALLRAIPLLLIGAYILIKH